MTSFGHAVVMTEVRISELKARLSEYLRKVRRGQVVVVLDRETPIARLVPYETDAALHIRKATRKPREVPVPPRPARPTDSLAVLLEDRSSR